MNLHANYSGVLNTIKSHKLCGASESDFLYLVEYHIGYTRRGPLNFGRGYYLRNGTTFKDDILTATGQDFRFPLLVSFVNPVTIVKIPPLETAENPRDLVDEVLDAGTTQEHGVTFRFSIEVGVKEMQRETFEWRRAAASSGRQDNEEGTGHKVKSLYTLHRLAHGYTAASTSTSPPSSGVAGAPDVVAMLAFNSVLSFTHLFTLELKGAGLTGELGDRWTLTAVTTALTIHLLRQLGKTPGASAGSPQKSNGK
ncbi:uncharacterized protein B0H64DRAFT_50596 [Chaetomium fimeti]|uniref:Uncharacterized protein n=1 Tax=Chaetomium fimeti TaxID=1854472 RepID=A0AAE0H6R4_9PEZI|nr:hypothetical protein B0H64DRAFT_50596 [Chaetomium fimeti]